MGERKQKKPRRCRKCGKKIEATAAEIKKHYEQCEG